MQRQVRDAGLRCVDRSMIMLAQGGGMARRLRDGGAQAERGRPERMTTTPSTIADGSNLLTHAWNIKYRHVICKTNLFNLFSL